MATISPRLDNQGIRIGWQARIRKKGYPQQVKTFRSKAEAERWAKAVETEMNRGMFVSRSESESTTLNDLLDRYSREVLPTLKGGGREASRISALRAGLGQYSLAAITSSLVAKYRDQRLATVSDKTGRPLGPQSVKHEIGLLQRALRKAVMEWGIALPGGIPTAMVSKPKMPKARDRRLVDDEEARLLAACAKARNPWLRPVVVFAIETAMRAGEMLESQKPDGAGNMVRAGPGLQWSNVDMDKRVALLPTTKNGEARDVPLSSRAVEVLKGLPRTLDGRVFGVTYEGIHQAFVRACRRAGIEGLHFHDLRHEATSRLFEKGFNPMEVSAITGHKTLQMLKRYTHLKAEDLAKRLG
ncbi:site-specific integrase [Acidithiobacillus caldus]|uniref:site-specific integrase n=1 Tax=Acidithiobacillus caldus TaxID=33059 RepID=UPI001C06C4E1|nr:site-specific integrase [Acidithiobacillus caldus]MBU2762246.1 site-specific integrase [Acidithiobacillus caldus]MBU2770482.1 site-specific integrase [Acidithiobacillus caldus]